MPRLLDKEQLVVHEKAGALADAVAEEFPWEGLRVPPFLLQTDSTGSLGVSQRVCNEILYEMG